MAEANPISPRHGLARACRAAAGGTGLAVLVGAALVGTSVFGLTLAVEGAVLLALAVAGRLPRALETRDRLLPFRPPSADSISRRLATFALLVLTLVGLAVRLVGLDTDLWLDEIVTVREYAALPLIEIVQTYGAANNHILHSLLVHLSTSMFGPDEWVVRLPALLAGTLTVPATYWLARRTQTRLLALAAAAVIALAYQHVFFSQNARGYTLWMLFALLSTGLLVDALRHDRVRSWTLYIPTAVLCAASVPIGVFVVAGQALVVTVLVAGAIARDGRLFAILQRPAGAFGLILLLTAQVYAGVVGEATGVARKAWESGEAGYEPLSRAFVAEVGRSAGVGASLPLALATAILALIGLAGLIALVRRDAALLAMLVLGPTIHLAYAAVAGLAFSPRFLVLWLFPAILVAIETLDRVGRALSKLGRGRGREIVVIGGAIVLGLGLVSPSRVLLGEPKQRYRDALTFAEEQRGDGLVVAIYTAEAGVRWYGSEHAGATRLVEGETFAVARTADRLAEVSRSADGRRLVLLTTFERGLAEGRPLLDRAVRASWKPAATFEGTIPGGGITVWVASDRTRP